MRSASVWLLIVVLVAACSSAPKDPCARFLSPYPDLVSGNARTERNSELVQAMQAYSGGDYAAAAEGLATLVEREPRNVKARFYLAVSLLMTDRPFDAEMHLDFVERDPHGLFHDEEQWYSLLCLVCSRQYDRARPVAEALSTRASHRYHQEAAELAAALRP